MLDVEQAMSEVQVITACPLCGSDRAPTKRVAVDLTRNCHSRKTAIEDGRWGRGGLDFPASDA